MNRKKPISVLPAAAVLLCQLTGAIAETAGTDTLTGTLNEPNAKQQQSVKTQVTVSQRVEKIAI